MRDPGSPNCWTGPHSYSWYSGNILEFDLSKVSRMETGSIFTQVFQCHLSGERGPRNSSFCVNPPSRESGDSVSWYALGDSEILFLTFIPVLPWGALVSLKPDTDMARKDCSFQRQVVCSHSGSLQRLLCDLFNRLPWSDTSLPSGLCSLGTD